MANYETRTVVTRRKEYFLSSPSNWAGVQKMLSAIHGELTRGGGTEPVDDTVTVEAATARSSPGSTCPAG